MDTRGIAKPVQINDGLGCIGIAAWILQLQVCEVALGIAAYPFIETLLVAIYHPARLILILVQVEILGGQDVVLIAIFLRFVKFSSRFVTCCSYQGITCEPFGISVDIRGEDRMVLA